MAQPVNCRVEIEFEHVDARFAENTPLAILGLLGHQGSHGFGRQPARSGDARDLILGGGRADVGIEAAGRSGDQIHRHRMAITRIGLA